MRFFSCTHTHYLHTHTRKRRYYLPFTENAIRYFFTLGFVPWRMRRISTGDIVPEIIPLGMFTWSVESITNRIARGRQRGPPNGGVHATHNFAGRIAMNVRDMHQIAAEKAFQKQKQYFSDPKHVPYPLQGDAMRLGTRRDSTEKAKQERLEGYANANAPSTKGEGGHEGRSKLESDPRDDQSRSSKRARGESSHKESRTPAYIRQRAALMRQNMPFDDDESKILRYCISFTENCNVMEDDVEIYEYMQPTNSITRASLLYGTVPTPLSHLLIDYRNIRTTQIRQAYADSFNTQVKALRLEMVEQSLFSDMPFLRHTHTHTHIPPQKKNAGQACVQLQRIEEHVPDV